MSILLLGETGFLGQEVSNLLFKKKTHSCKIDLSKIKLISKILKKKKTRYNYKLCCCRKL